MATIGKPSAPVLLPKKAPRKPFLYQEWEVRTGAGEVKATKQSKYAAKYWAEHNLPIGEIYEYVRVR